MGKWKMVVRIQLQSLNSEKEQFGQTRSKIDPAKEMVGSQGIECCVVFKMSHI